MKNVTCLKCGTVSMGVSRRYAEEEIAAFNKYYDSLPENEKDFWSGHSNLEKYRCCKRMELRDFREGDCPDGVTIGPVISS